MLSVLLLAAASVVGAPAPFPKAEWGTDLAKLQGEWVEGEWLMTVPGERVFWRHPQFVGVIEDKVPLSAADSPKTIDLTGVESGLWRKGIDKIEGDTLTISLAFAEDGRPLSFNEQGTFVLRRKKP